MGKKICSTWIVVRDFMFWMLHVLLTVCLYILLTVYVQKENMYRFICMLTVKKYACTIVLFFTLCKNKESDVMVM